jgi:hypothetical protein
MDPVAELAKSSQDGDGAQSASSATGVALLEVVEGGEAIDDGLAGNHTAQDDQVMSRMTQVGIDH